MDMDTDRDTDRDKDRYKDRDMDGTWMGTGIQKGTFPWCIRPWGTTFEFEYVREFEA
jgi:hypothetical protein